MDISLTARASRGRPNGTRRQQHLMSRIEFEKWMNLNHIRVLVTRPHLVTCECGDAACHGWRFVACDIDPLAGA
jgi:hypothetical protein